MNQHQKALINTYHRFLVLWVKHYGYNETFTFKLGYYNLVVFTNKPQIGWEVLEQLKDITDKNNTAWSISYTESGLTIKFEK